MNTVQIIVYGTLMTGERNHRYCRNAISIQPCTITGTIYDTGWGFPAFSPEGDTAVHAELIEIPIADWPAMDRLEGYPPVLRPDAGPGDAGGRQHGRGVGLRDEHHPAAGTGHRQRRLEKQGVRAVW